MALIPAHRRYFGLIALSVLVLLMLGMLVPDPVGEWHPFRVVAGRNDLGPTLNALRAVRNYVEDNFGYARSLPYLRGMLEYSLGTPSYPQIYFGQRRHLFYSGENAVSQATGSLYRVAEVRHFVDVVDALRRALALSNDHLVVLMPPSAQSILMRDQPTWWRISGPLEYDLAISELRSRGLATLDLKAAFNASPEVDHLYRHTDSHWRWNAALMAFNMAMRAIGHDEWSLDPATALAPLAPAPDGDLARLLGVQGHLSDTDYALRITPQADAWTAIDVLRVPPAIAPWAMPYSLQRASAGERLLVLGDSFTMEFWRPLLLHTGAARIGWMHFANCTFDFDDVARFRPTQVVVEWTERLIHCNLSSWPRGLPRDAADRVTMRVH